MNLIEFKDYPSTETPLNAENLNHNFNELNKANIYSTEEQVIGNYAGRTLYRKIITVGKNQLPNNSYVNIKHNIENMDYMVDIRGFIYENPITNSTWFYPIPYASPTVGKITMVCSRTEIQIESSMNLLNNLANIIIEYTKTNE
jgi:hypothetical protein